MRQKRHSTRLLVAALTTLLTGSLAGISGLVLCLGSDGHRVIELEHGGRECPTLAASKGATGISVQGRGECVDLPTAGTGPIVSSLDAERVPTPPVAFLAVSLEPTPRIETRLPGPTNARAGPPNLAPHLRSTVLLV